MFRFDSKVLLRSIRQKPIYSFISIFGFAIGIAASILIYFWVLDELSYEKFHPNYERIYRVLSLRNNKGNLEKTASSYTALSGSLQDSYPQIETATHISFSSENSPLKLNRESKKIEARRAWVDDNFFQVFQGFNFVEGNSLTALDNPLKVVLSKATARKLFGDDKALGKTLISDKYEELIFTVGGVVNIPAQSHIDFGFIQSNKAMVDYNHTSHSWRISAHCHTYIMLQADANIDKSFLKQISSHVQENAYRQEKLTFQPIADIHLYTDYDTYLYDRHISDVKYVWIFAGLAMLIVAMAALNFASLTTARASERATEIGVRKVNGSSKKQLVVQFILESLMQTSIATVLAIIATVIMLPCFEGITGKTLAITFSPALLFTGLLLVLITGVVSGIYPAFYLTSFNPIHTIKGKLTTYGRAGYAQLLVVIQFSIAIVLLISSITITRQMNYINNYNLGLNKNNVVVIPTGLWYSSSSFKHELLSHPNIISASASTQAPINLGWKQGFSLSGINSNDTIQACMLFVDSDFAKTYELEVVKGEFLRQSYADYWKEFETAKNNKQHKVTLPVVVNQSFARQMNVDDPIGRRINRDYVIVGVVDDFHYQPLHRKVSPMVMLNDPQNIMTMNVKMRPNNKAQTIAFIRSIYMKHRQGRFFSFAYFDDKLKQVYNDETRLNDLIVKFSVLALIIAIMGILGLSIFAAEQKTKEIGIRKVNGAKVSEILLLLNRNFIKWVGIAFVIACPIAYLVMTRWLNNFAYKTDLSWWIFALAGFLALIIVLITVSWQSWWAARQNPVKALRYE
ncbi:ABC transporter permease [Carboxylicivirga sp. N1Y90]|uniref:ABC transporter permease n=1 Tax=Carboxylicivirga fragile TaxID=3417571 RepID=UPI003D3282E4|nr:ABC transporter permease [Marinilabiliaceae bacterium N1Y90]